MQDGVEDNSDFLKKAIEDLSKMSQEEFQVWTQEHCPWLWTEEMQRIKEIGILDLS